MKKNFFTFMSTPEFKQNWFDLGHTNSGSCNMGSLVPILVEPTLPGDYFKCNISYLLRMAQMVAPPMSRIGVSFMPFYCPNRILMDSREWDKFLSDIDGEHGVSLPVLNWSTFQSVINESFDKVFIDNEDLHYDYKEFCEFLNSDSSFMEGLRNNYDSFNDLEFVPVYGVGYNSFQLFGYFDNEEIGLLNPTEMLRFFDFGEYGNQNLRHMLLYLFSKYLGSSPFVGSLLDFMGLPVNSPALTYQSLIDVSYHDSSSGYNIIKSGTSIDFNIQVLPFLAYLYIWNEYFRQEFIQEEIPSELLESFNTYKNSNSFDLSILWKLKRRDWEHDYFTSALPSPQLGNSSSITIGADGKFTIPELREANIIQRVREKMLHGGSRIWEILCNFFNERVADSRIQKPEFIRPAKNTGFSWLRISDIYQTAPGSSDTFPTLDASANIAAPRGASANTGNNGLSFRFKAEEHGYIIVLMNIQPEPVYCQGIPKHFTYLDCLDYGWPDFANLTEQPVYDYEIFASDLSMIPGLNGYGVFGYQPQYSAYKFHNSELHGELRDDLDFFHFARIFPDSPALNSEFLECNPSDRPFPISYEYDKLTYHLAIDLRVNRRLPYYGIPSLR